MKGKRFYLTPVKSFEIVEGLGELSPDVRNIIWEHHERH